MSEKKKASYLRKMLFSFCDPAGIKDPKSERRAVDESINSLRSLLCFFSLPLIRINSIRTK
jgi:hypothetical protein